MQNFEEKYKAGKEKEKKKRKAGDGSGTPGGVDSETDTGTPPPAKQRHPAEESRPRGFERGLQAEKIIGNFIDFLTFRISWETPDFDALRFH